MLTCIFYLKKINLFMPLKCEKLKDRSPRLYKDAPDCNLLSILQSLILPLLKIIPMLIQTLLTKAAIKQ